MDVTDKAYRPVQWYTNKELLLDFSAMGYELAPGVPAANWNQQQENRPFYIGKVWELNSSVYDHFLLAYTISGKELYLSTPYNFTAPLNITRILYETARKEGRNFVHEFSSPQKIYRQWGKNHVLYENVSIDPLRGFMD